MYNRGIVGEILFIINMTDIATQIYNLALKVYQPDEVSPLKLYETLCVNHPESFLVETQGDEVLGYIILCYLDKDSFKLTLNPGFKENQIDFTKQIAKTENVYFFSIVVKPDLDNKYIAMRLIKKFKVFLKKQNITAFSSLIYSPEGKRLSQAFKMDLINNQQFVKYLIMKS